VAKYGNYVRKFMWQLCGWDTVDISLTVHSRAILKIVKSTYNGIKTIKCTPMKCHANVNSTPPTQLPHKFSYIVAILGHNHFESPNTYMYWIYQINITPAKLPCRRVEVGYEFNNNKFPGQFNSKNNFLNNSNSMVNDHQSNLTRV
jgi:hypothetical protein